MADHKEKSAHYSFWDEIQIIDKVAPLKSKKTEKVAAYLSTYSMYQVCKDFNTSFLYFIKMLRKRTYV